MPARHHHGKQRSRNSTGIRRQKQLQVASCLALTLLAFLSVHVCLPRVESRRTGFDLSSSTALPSLNWERTHGTLPIAMSDLTVHDAPEPRAIGLQGNALTHVSIVVLCAVSSHSAVAFHCHQTYSHSHFAEVDKVIYTSFGIAAMDGIFMDTETCQINKLSQYIDSYVNLMKLADVRQLRAQLTAEEQFALLNVLAWVTSWLIFVPVAPALYSFAHRSTLLHLVYLMYTGWHLITELQSTWNLWQQKASDPDGIWDKFLKLIVLTFCVWFSSDWLLHQPIQAVLFALGLVNSICGQTYRPCRCSRCSLRNAAVLVLKSSISVRLIENFQVIKPLWVEIYPFHAALLIWSSITPIQASFLSWWSPVPCGAHAANALLDGNIVTDSMLRKRHKELHKPTQLYHERGASVDVLLSLLAECGIHMRNFVTKFDSTDTHLLLNNGTHWKSMRRTRQGWKLYDNGSTYQLTTERADLLVNAHAIDEACHIISLKRGKPMALERQNEYTGPSMFGKGHDEVPN